MHQFPPPEILNGFTAMLLFAFVIACPPGGSLEPPPATAAARISFPLR